MADYCNKCTQEILGDSVKPEIDVYKIGNHLCNGCIENCLCEGCEMMGVYKDGSGNLYVLYEEYSRDGVEVKKVLVKEWEKKGSMNSFDPKDLALLVGVQVVSSVNGNKIKVMPGREGTPGHYHVLIEDSHTGENRYSYLSNQEILDKFGFSPQSRIA